MQFDLCPITWEGISAIFSGGMIILTVLALRQNHKQLVELRKQREEDNRARIVLSLVADRIDFYIKVSNVGKETAYDISIEIEKDFLESLLFDYHREVLDKLKNPFVIEAGKSKYYAITPIHLEDSTVSVHNQVLESSITNEWLEKNINQKFTIYGRYCNKYEIKECFCIKDFFNGGMIVDDQLTESVKDLAKASVVHNNEYMPIQKSLDIIAKELQNTRRQNEQSNK